MFDNLREQANSQPFLEDEAQFQEAGGFSSASQKSSDRFLGMTAPQRFVISLMLMFTVCIFGALALLITGKFGI